MLLKFGYRSYQWLLGDCLHQSGHHSNVQTLWLIRNIAALITTLAINFDVIPSEVPSVSQRWPLGSVCDAVLR